MEHFSFLDHLNVEEIFLFSKNSNKQFFEHESSILRLISRVLKEETYPNFLDKTLILNHTNFLKNLQSEIYKKYHSKNVTTIVQSFDLKKEFEKLKNEYPPKLENGWQYDEINNTLRKNGEKLLPKNGKFFVNLLSSKYSLLIEEFKENIDIPEVENQDHHYWIQSKVFQTEGFSNRIYFNASIESKLYFVFLKVLKEFLNQKLIPFKIKFPKNANDFYDLTDNTVLYFPRENTIQVFEVIKMIHLHYDFKNIVNPEIPLFTYKLLDGVGFGESPDSTIYSSFGSYRASILAILILKQLLNSEFKKFKIDHNSLIDDLENFYLLKQEIRINTGQAKSWKERFFTNQFSVYDYSFHFDYFRKFIPVKRRSDFGSKNVFLEAAKNIAASIWNDAYFYPMYGEKELYCNWIQCNKTLNDEKGEFGYEYGSLNGSFEEGIPGVVFFLINFQKINPSKFNYTISYRSVLGFIKQEGFTDEKEFFFTIFKYFKSNSLFSKFRNKNKSEFNLKINRITKTNKVLNLIDKVVFNDYKLDNSEKKILRDLVEYQQKGFSFLNFQLNEEPNYSLGYGYALLGYFFLRLHDPILFPKLEAQIIHSLDGNDIEVMSPPSP